MAGMLVLRSVNPEVEERVVYDKVHEEFDAIRRAAPASWTVAGQDASRFITGIPLAWGATEAEALVVALERAP